MIEKLRVRNFRCLRDVEVPLGPLNFLVGPNNTGKSSLLEAIEVLSRCMSVDYVANAFQQLGLRLERTLTQPSQSRLLEYSVDARLPATDPGGQWGHYELVLRPNAAVLATSHEAVFVERETIELADVHGGMLASFTRAGAGQSQVKAAYSTGKTDHFHLHTPYSTVPYSMFRKADPRFAGLAAALRSSPKYSLVPQRVAEPCEVVERAELRSDGYGLATCLDNLHNSDPERFGKIEDALRSLVPGIEMVRFPAADTGKKTILFHEAGGAKVHASEASHGLLLFLAHLTVAYAHGDVGVVLIEEPENAVHPRRLRDIVHLLRAISRGELGLPPVQVIATSHSPLLVDCCDKEEVIVFQRDAERGSYTTPLSQVKDIDEHLKDFAPGELITTFGEQICGSRS